MSINWVMLSDDGAFTPLPGEQTLYTSPPRTSLSLQSLAKQTHTEAFSIQSSAGHVYLTNRRVVYLPSSPTPTLQSFTVPLLNLHDTHVTAPWFGPNVWTSLLQPVSGGGIPAQHAALELKLTFKDGGAFDFHTGYERIKERLQQAVELARESGVAVGDGTERSAGRGGGALEGVDMGAVHLDQLPRYEEASRGEQGREREQQEQQQQRDSGVAVGRSEEGRKPEEEEVEIRPPAEEPFTPPLEPPPGYEEVQRDSVATELEQRLRESEERRYS
ncbi:hypothetical protein EV356DRAFT_486036 [Viridothelium virens]|uniref:WW-domain-binding protein n=1 Tax=Viridothelium virens TaxID=1048519 RepID=A0A6A6H888_VIRVR|nr:hypothetical protein EV356DRAFT_486036 [Viridothelium virens]